MKKPVLQRQRLLAQMGFFTLFALTPVFDLLRYDLTERHAYFLTFPWHIGIDELIAGTGDAQSAAVNLIFYLFFPILGTLGLIILVAWKWGRLYCGWLCPHFSVVETINRLMLFASGKHSVWDKKKTPPWEPDGTIAPRDRRYWLAVVPAAIGFAFAWAIVGLTYLMPPFQVYGGLLNFTLLPGEVIFLCAATTVLSLEFLFARHLFCRFVCAVGLFQSLAWMGNKNAMVVGFKRERASDCSGCLPNRQSACDAVCPMRLRPRTIKRHMFTCTQCAQCVDACAETQRDNPNGPLLSWVSGEAARQNEAGFRTVRER